MKYKWRWSRPLYADRDFVVFSAVYKGRRRTLVVRWSLHEFGVAWAEVQAYAEPGSVFLYSRGLSRRAARRLWTTLTAPRETVSLPTGCAEEEY